MKLNHLGNLQFFIFFFPCSVNYCSVGSWCFCCFPSIVLGVAAAIFCLTIELCTSALSAHVFIDGSVQLAMQYTFGIANIQFRYSDFSRWNTPGFIFVELYITTVCKQHDFGIFRTSEFHYISDNWQAARLRNWEFWIAEQRFSLFFWTENCNFYS